MFPRATLTIPAISFGDVGLCQVAALEQNTMSSLDDVGPAAIELSESYIYGLTNAVVYPPGIVTVNGKVLKETLAHIPFGQLGYARSEHTVELPDAASHTDLAEAFHLLGGNNQNYFHWMLDILPRLQVEPFANRRFAGPILVPSMRTTFQRDSLALLLAQPNPVISVTDHEAVRVGTLHFIPNLVGYGFAPSPNLNTFFDILKQRLTARSGLARRIYVSRKDSGNRRLINEDAVISLVSKYGFEVVELSRLTLSEQASVFASATQIVAPHGA